jgi:hypothetical protein
MSLAGSLPLCEAFRDLQLMLGGVQLNVLHLGVAAQVKLKANIGSSL